MSAQGKRIHGILLEGINYSGKSTVARLLGERLAARGVPLLQRHCYLVESPISAELQQQAFGSVTGWQDRAFPDAELLRSFNVRKSAQMLYDSALAAETDSLDGQVVLQDRHWFTQYCSNEFFNPGEGLLSKKWVRQHAPRFTLQVYLTCSQDERQRRAGERTGPEKHNLNSYQRAHLAELGLYDELCLSLIKDDPTWRVVHTDDLSVTVVVDEILEAFDTAPPVEPGRTGELASWA
jgi:thymidylate kinase